MPDRDRWEVRGPVRTLHLQRNWRSTKCEPGSTCEIEESGDRSIVDFRPDGAMAHHWHQNPDGSESNETYRYDSADRLATVEFASSSLPSHVSGYEYDEAGRLTRCFSRDANGSERTIDSYSYDAQGAKSKTHAAYLAAEHPNSHVAWGVEGSTVHYSARNVEKLITNYDQAGRPIELLFYEVAGAIVSRVDFAYDKSGNLIEEKQTHMDSPFMEHFRELNAEQQQAVQAILAGPLVHFRHRYDGLGNRIETLRSLFGSLGTERILLGYNEHGDLVSQTSEESTRAYNFDDIGQLVDRPDTKSRSEARFLYEYDSRGNWTSKISEARHGDRDFVVTTAEKRALTYFDNL